MYAMRWRAYTGRIKSRNLKAAIMVSEAQMSLAPAQLVNFPAPVPDSAGIPQTVSDEMLIAPFNDEAFVESLVAEYADEIACIIVEPLQRLIPPAPGFLACLRNS